MSWTFAVGMATGLVIAYAHAFGLLYTSNRHLRKRIDGNPRKGR